MFTLSPDLFWKKVDRSGGVDACWPWLRALTDQGYGTLSIGGGKTDRSHRVALRLSGIEVSSGAVVCHRCNNTRCCNPSHLYVGDAKTNAADMVASGGSKEGGRKRAGRANHMFVDLTGRRFGRLKVMKLAPRLARHGCRWVCKCSCGQTTIKWTRDLRSGAIVSCGCYVRELARKRMLGKNNPARSRA